MTLYELSFVYRAEAEALRIRIAELRREKKGCSAQQRGSLEVRIARLTAIQRETRELAVLLEHYYERGYTRNAKYTL